MKRVASFALTLAAPTKRVANVMIPTAPPLTFLIEPCPFVFNMLKTSFSLNYIEFKNFDFITIITYFIVKTRDFVKFYKKKTSN